MPKIYVANATSQRAELNYRLPTEINPKSGRMMFSDRLNVERIPAGAQICLGAGRDFSDLEVKHIFEHQQNYGARRDGEQGPGFVGLIFSHKPIVLDHIRGAIVQNKEAADERSDAMLGATAQNMLDEHSKLAQATGTAPPERFELEIAADQSKDIDVGGKGAEATQEGVSPNRRARRAA